MPSFDKLPINLEKGLIPIVVGILLEFKNKGTLPLHNLLRKPSHSFLHPQSSRITKTHKFYLPIQVRLLSMRNLRFNQIIFLCVFPDILSTRHETVDIQRKYILVGVERTLVFNSFLHP